MTPSEVDFHLEEYKQIRDEVTSLITKTEQLVQYCVLIAAGVFTWLTALSFGMDESGPCSKVPVSGDIAQQVWWIPAGAVLVVGLLGLGRFVRVKEMGKYLQQLEDAMGHKSLGWEKFLSRQPITVAVVTVVAWLALLVGTAYVAVNMQDLIQSGRGCIVKSEPSK